MHIKLTITLLNTFLNLNVNSAELHFVLMPV